MSEEIAVGHSERSRCESISEDAVHDPDPSTALPGCRLPTAAALSAARSRLLTRLSSPLFSFHRPCTFLSHRSAEHGDDRAQYQH
jgi:hypothetical protein